MENQLKNDFEILSVLRNLKIIGIMWHPEREIPFKIKDIKIKNDLSQNFGFDVKLNYNYDPDLIGGLIMQVESVMIDTSIKNKLQQIKNKMIEA